jgi:phage terminase large subunit GpA-like protein
MFEQGPIEICQTNERYKILEIARLPCVAVFGKGLELKWWEKKRKGENDALDCVLRWAVTINYSMSMPL